MPGQLLDFDGRPIVYGANGAFGGPFFPHDLIFEEAFQPPVVPEVQDVATPPLFFGLLEAALFPPGAADPAPPLNLHDWLLPIFGGAGGQAPSENTGPPGFFGGSRGPEVPVVGAADPALPFNLHDLLTSLFGSPSEPPIDSGIGNSLFG